MVDPKVQQHGDIAVLTFNLISHGARFGQGPKGDVRWNSTEVYQRISGQWKIIHSHWSYTQPQLKEKPAE
jgi:ketosteroid isomerase-like protein